MASRNESISRIFEYCWFLLYRLTLIIYVSHYTATITFFVYAIHTHLQVRVIVQNVSTVEEEKKLASHR